MRPSILFAWVLLAWGCRESPPEVENEVAPQVATPVEVDARPATVAIFAEPEAHALVQLQAFIEGPTWHPDGYLLVTDIHHDQVLRYRPGATALEVAIEPSGRAAGTALDGAGQLLVCEGNEHGPGGRSLARWNLATHTRTTVVDRYEGKRFNSPNDLDIDSRGRIYFSDPHYFEDPEHEFLELDDETVYRVGPDGQDLVRVLDPGAVLRPNGVALSLDERTLYVTDTTKGAAQLLYAFELDEQGLATGVRRTLYDFGSGRGGDGMCLDAVGNLFVGSGRHQPPDMDTEVPAGLQVFDASGKLVARLAVDDFMLTNCTHGGADGRTLYMTGAGALWSIAVHEPGVRRGVSR